MSPALQGGFLTTGPPGKSLGYIFFKKTSFKNTEPLLHSSFCDLLFLLQYVPRIPLCQCV